MKTNITGAPGGGVNAVAIEAQEEMLTGLTKETSDFIKKIQTSLLNPSVLLVIISVIFVFTIEILWGSYFKTKYSDEFAKDLTCTDRTIMYLTWILITIIVLGVLFYFASSFILGEELGKTITKKLSIVTLAIIAFYLLNTIISTSIGNETSYTILGNFLAIK